jgi:hypothetical protein
VSERPKLRLRKYETKRARYSGLEVPNRGSRPLSTLVGKKGRTTSRFCYLCGHLNVRAVNCRSASTAKCRAESGSNFAIDPRAYMNTSHDHWEDPIA